MTTPVLGLRVGQRPGEHRLRQARGKPTNRDQSQEELPRGGGRRQPQLEHRSDDDVEAYEAQDTSQYPIGARRGSITQLTFSLVDECVAVAEADGVTLPGDVDVAVRKIAETAAGQYSSTAQDLSRGKRSEIDHLNGLIVRRGEALGITTPANRLLHAIVKLIESK